MKVTTQHLEIGYTNNIEIVQRTIREKFGIEDNSHIGLAVAAHVWSVICQTSSPEKQWGTEEVVIAIATCLKRLADMEQSLRCKRSDCAVGYPHFHHS